jgi:FkbM family methyltransferase
MDLVECEYLDRKIKVIRDDKYVSRCAPGGYIWDNWMVGTVIMAGARTPGGIFIDIGANIGLNSIMFSRYGEVHAFEPVFHDVLSDNVKGLKVHVYPFALSNCKGSKEIFIENPIDGSCTGNRSKMVDTERLDDIICDPVAFIKIDVEHHGYDILDGARDTIDKYKPIICIESFDRSRLEEYTTGMGYTQLFEFPESNYVLMP